MEWTRSADGTPLALERTGAGPAVVVVAGALCDRATFAGLADLLGTDLTVWRDDRRGRGDSGDTPPYAVAREVDDLAAVVAHAEGAAGVFGHSSGAAVALEAAAAGVAVGRLAVYEPPYGSGADPGHDALHATLTELVAAGRPAAAVWHFLGAAGLPPAMLDAIVADPRTVRNGRALPHETAVVGGDGVPARLASVTAPTLVLGGADSPPFFAGSVAAVAALVPGARVVTLPGQGHEVADAALAPLLAAYFGRGSGGA